MSEAIEAVSATPDEDTVALLLEAVRRFAEDEGRRGESLNERGSAIAGFLGIVIVLAGSVETATFGGGGEYHAVAASLAVAALVCLLISVGLIGWGVLLPTAADAISIEDVERFPNNRFIVESPMMTNGYLMRGTVAVLRRERERNNRKARWLRFGYLGMGAGLLLVTGAGIVLTIHAIAHV